MPSLAVSRMLSSGENTVRITKTAIPSLFGDAPRSIASSNWNRERELNSGATVVRKPILDSARDQRYASTVRGTTAHTTVIGADICTPPGSKERDRNTIQKYNEVYGRLHTNSGSNIHPNKLWRVNEV